MLACLHLPLSRAFLSLTHKRCNRCSSLFSETYSQCDLDRARELVLDRIWRTSGPLTPSTLHHRVAGYVWGWEALSHNRDQPRVGVQPAVGSLFQGNNLATSFHGLRSQVEVKPSPQMAGAETS